MVGLAAGGENGQVVEFAMFGYAAGKCTFWRIWFWNHAVVLFVDDNVLVDLDTDLGWALEKWRFALIRFEADFV